METIKTAGLKLAMDGSAEFARSLKSINAELKTNSAQLQKLTAEYGKNSTNTQVLRQKSELLSDRLSKQKEVTANLNDKLKETEEKYGKNSVEAEKMRAKVEQSETAELKLQKQLDEVNRELEKQTSKLVGVGAALENAGGKISGAGKTMAGFGKTMSIGVTAPIIAATGLLMKAGGDFEEATSIIAKATGATGDALEEFKEDAKAVAATVPNSLSDIGGAIGEINTRMGFTGDALRTASTDFLNFSRITGTDVVSSVRLVSRAMGDAGIDSSEYKTLLNQLTVAAQASGVSIDTLTEQLAKYGAPMRALGFSTAETIALFSQWEAVGVNTEIAFSGMKKAIGNWGKEGKDARVEFKKTLDEIAATPDIASATTKAIEVFGVKAGPDLADAVKGGRFEYEKFLDKIEGGETALDDTAAASLTFKDELKMLGNEISIAVEPASKSLLKSFREFKPTIVAVINKVAELVGKFTSLSTEQQGNILKWIAIAAVAGPVIGLIGKITQGVGGLVTVFGKMIKAIGESATAGALMSGPGGWIMLAVGAIAALAVVIANIPSEMDKLTDSIEKQNEAITPWVDEYGEAASRLDDINKAISDSGHTLDEVNGVIDAAEQGIYDILKSSYDNQEGLRQEDLDNIKAYNEELTNAEAEKLEMYQENQRTALTMIGLEAKNITTKNNAEYLKTVEDGLNQANEATQAAYERKIQIINQQNKAGAFANQEAYQKELQAAQAWKDEQIGINQSLADEAYAIVTKSSSDHMIVETDKYNQLKAITDQHAIDQEAYFAGLDELNKQAIETGYSNNAEQEKLLWERDAAEQRFKDNYKMVLESIDKDTANAWFSMLLQTKQKGGEIDDASKTTASNILSAFANLPSDMQESGKETLLGMIKGIEDQVPGLEDAANMSAEEIIDTLNTALDIHSPSGKTEWSGEQVGEGLALGVENKKGRVSGAAQSVGGLLLSGLKNILGIHSPSRPAREFANLVDDGLIYGLLDKIKEVEKASDKVAEAALPDLPDLNRELEKVIGGEAEINVRIRKEKDADDERKRQEEKQSLAALIADVLVDALNGLSVNLDGRLVGRAQAKG